MRLDWHFDIPRNRLSLSLDDNIHYVAHSGGKEGITKTSIGKNDVLISYDNWPDELRWISDNYKDVYGELEIPPELTDEEAHEFMEVTGCPAYPAWGFSKPYTKDDPDGVYDRLARPGWFLRNKNGVLMSNIAFFEGTGRFESDGTNIYKRGWDEEQDTIYNCMPCCVFPKNPGWQLSSVEELQEAGYIGEPILKPGLDPELLAKHFTLP